MTTLQELTTTQIESWICRARKELSRRVTADDPFKPIKGQEHCKRALIVAAVQGHSVAVYGPHGSGKTMLVRAGRKLGVSVAEGTPCPCGSYTDPRLPCKCTEAAIRQHQKQLSFICGPSDLHVECPAVPTNELLSKQHGTTTAQAQDQLERVRELPSKTELASGCDHIIKQVVSEVGMSAKTLSICLSVAQSIAALAARDTIQVEDILEAVHYRPLDKLKG